MRLLRLLKDALANVFRNALWRLLPSRRLQRQLLSALLAASLVSSPALAAEDFVIEDIRIDGLQRFDPGTVFNPIKIEIGDTMTEEKSIEIIKTLFETGFFRSVEVLREENVLILAVEENPTIAEVNFSGVDEIPEDTLESMLKNADIVKARVFDRSLVEEAAKALTDIYIERNYYNATVTPVVSPLPRNRVAILFEVEEGKQAAIRSIDITGNDAVSTWALRRAMNLEPRSIFNFWSDDYLFSEDKLEADLERIRTLYLEDGFLRFQVEARQAEVSPDKKYIDIRIRIKEGQQYLLARPDAEKTFVGDIPPQASEDEMLEFIEQVPGEVFSTQKASETVAKIRDYLGNFGYAFAEVAYDNQINDEEGTVEVVYQIMPGKPVYINKIEIIGNERTRDEVIRRELLQFEQERFSRHKIESSQRRIRRLGYFNNVSIEQEKVEQREDQLDLKVNVDEGGVGVFRIGAGFSTDNQLSFDVGLDTPNVFGSGNNFAADFSSSSNSKRINMSLDEYYYTEEGVSRHVGMSIADRESSSNSSGYNIDGISAEYGYGIPYADDGKYDMKFVYEKIKINSVDQVYNNFRDKHGSNLDVLLLRTGFLHDTRDSPQQPTIGYRFDVSSEIGLPVLDLRYYRVNLLTDYYKQTRGFWGKPVWHARGGLGFGGSYGGDVYPFYQRFYVGGSDTLRGFDSSSIGGKYSATGAAVGGLARAYGSIESVVDTELFKTQKVYLAPFLDVGTVGSDIAKLSKWRSSAGVEVRWISPLGPLRFSWSTILKKHPGDRTQTLQFTISY